MNARFKQLMVKIATVTKLCLIMCAGAYIILYCFVLVFIYLTERPFSNRGTFSRNALRIRQQILDRPVLADSAILPTAAHENACWLAKPWFARPSLTLGTSSLYLPIPAYCGNPDRKTASLCDAKLSRYHFAPNKPASTSPREIHRETVSSVLRGSDCCRDHVRRGFDLAGLYRHHHQAQRWFRHFCSNTRIRVRPPI